MKIGFIGAGNMATAIISGIIKSKFVANEDIYVNDIIDKNLSNLKELYGINIGNKEEVVNKSDIVVLAVKPNHLKGVIEDIRINNIKETIFVSIAAGQTINNIESMFDKDVKLVRCMPNTPAMVGEGMTGLCGNQFVKDSEIKLICDLFNTIGKAEIVDEKQMDAVVAVSGSSPAYVYMMIEAMADAAVLEGLQRDKAYLFAAQAVLGSAKMVLESGIHPADLKDKVCSPGGTTIEAVKVLEEKGYRASIIDAMKACADKSKSMK